MTSLIEQLGGYEACSNAYKELISKDKDIITCGSTIITKDQMRDMLLEYRRQHNIYEEGDWIIYDDDLMVFAMWSKHHNEYAYIGYANADDGALEHRSAFRHATDEEIAQGYRDE